MPMARIEFHLKLNLIYMNEKKDVRVARLLVKIMSIMMAISIREKGKIARFIPK